MWTPFLRHLWKAMISKMLKSTLPVTYYYNKGKLQNILWFCHISFHSSQPFILKPSKALEGKIGRNNAAKQTPQITMPEKTVRKPSSLETACSPPFSNIFLLIHTSWSFLISPLCLGIAIFLEANLSAFADDSLSSVS